MNLQEIRQISSRYRELNIFASEYTKGLLLGERGNTLIYLWIDGDSLEKYQVTWSSFVTYYSAGFKIDLCSGVKNVVLQIVARPPLKNAGVFLGDKYLGEISEVLRIDAPLGSHSLSIRQDDRVIFKKELSYREQSHGYDRLEVRTAVE